jgi:hypothetical protein
MTPSWLKRRINLPATKISRRQNNKKQDFVIRFNNHILHLLPIAVFQTGNIHEMLRIVRYQGKAIPYAKRR